METELKLLLPGASEAARLVEAFGPPLRIELQENLYFDGAARRWSAAGIGLRLRRLEDRAILTVKGEGMVQDGLSSRPEAERCLSIEEFAELRAGGPALAAAIRPLLAQAELDVPEGAGEDSLVVVGVMRNRRRVLECPVETAEGLGMEVDETTYPDGSVVWEVEFEWASPDPSPDSLAAVSRQLRALFSRLGLPFTPSALSKRARLEQVLAGRRRR